MVGTGNAILKHVHKSVTQSDEHLLNAAKAGLFARDFDPRTQTQGNMAVRKKDGKVQRFDVLDPDDVDITALVHPRNLTKSGEIDQGFGGDKDDSTFLLPTLKPTRETGYWKAHEEGVYGNLEDLAQRQREWLVDAMAQNLADKSKGQPAAQGNMDYEMQSPGGHSIS